MQEPPITDAEMFIVRLLREATASARTIADLRQALTTRNDAQANAIEHLTARCNAAEGRR